jgi:hypothetical protein
VLSIIEIRERPMHQAKRKVKIKAPPNIEIICDVQLV